MGLIGARAYSEVVTLADFKAAMRRAREAHGARAKLQDATGIDESTIYRIETDEKYDPSISTVTTLIQGMGLSLSVFFAEAEAITNLSLQKDASPLHNPDGVVSPVSNTPHQLRAEPATTSESRDGLGVPPLRTFTHDDIGRILAAHAGAIREVQADPQRFKRSAPKRPRQSKNRRRRA